MLKKTIPILWCLCKPSKLFPLDLITDFRGVGLDFEQLNSYLYS